MEEESINIRDYIQVLLRRKYLILLVFVVCLPFIVMKAFSHETVYRTSTKLFIQKNEPAHLLENNRQRYDPNFLATQIEIIKSAKVAEKVVRNLELHENYDQYFSGEERDTSVIQDVQNWFRNVVSVGLKLAGLVKDAPESGGSEGESLSEAEKEEQRIRSLAGMVRGGLSVSPSGGGDSSRGQGSDIVSVGFTSRNPEFAKKIVNNVASAYKEFLLEMQMASTGDVLEWMRNQADSQREKLEASEKELQEYKKKHGIYISDGRGEELLPAKISEFSRRLTRAEAEVNELESLYQEISRISPQEALSLPVVLENEIVRDLRRKVIEQEQAISEMSRRIGEKHPRMIRAQKDLDALQEKLEEEIQTVIQSVKNRYKLAEEKARSIELMLDQAKYEAAEMSDQLFMYEILNRDVEVNRLLYDRLITRIKEYGATENKQSTDVWVIEKAERPLPMTQRPKRTLMLGLAVSLMAGVGLAFFLEHLDNTVKTAEDAEARLDMPVLGMVPMFTDKSYEVEKIIHQLPHSVISERYRAIRTAIMLSSAGDAGILLVTSMMQKTGKTVTAANLAISLAQTGRRVLLVDADMRRPKIHKVFGVNNKNGLSTVLSGESEGSITTAEESPFLHILTAGPIPPNPSELLISAQFGELVRDWQATYDYVVFDSPPMADVTDAVLISKIAGQTLLVTRSGISTYESVRQAEKALKTINATVLGQIVNAVDEKKHNYYHYKYYGRSGGYYGEETPPVNV